VANTETIGLKDGREVQVFATEADCVTAIATETVAAAKSAIAEKGAFSMALSTGLPAKALNELKRHADGVDFSKFHVYFCYDAIGVNACYKEARESWTDACGVPPEQVHAVADFPPEGAAAQYTASICMQDESVIADSPTGLPAVDLMLLGVNPCGADPYPGGSRMSWRTAEA